MIFPSSVIMEVSALCNVSCLGCAFHGPFSFVKRPLGNMKREIWESVIKEISSWNRDVSIILHGGGEPLLNPDLKEIVQTACSCSGIKEVGFLTNGMLLDESWSSFITDLKLDWVAFSIDGVSPETHDSIRKKSNLLKVESNLDILLEMKKKKNSLLPHVKLNMVTYDEIAGQKDAFIKKWIDKVDAVMISNYRNPPESKRWGGTPEKRKPCPLLWNQAVVAWDGRIGLCCEDFNIDYSPGVIDYSSGIIDSSPDFIDYSQSRTGESMKGQTLLELWNNSAIEKVRALHTNGEYDLHLMCRSCDSWAEECSWESIECEKGYNAMKSISQTVYSRDKACLASTV